MITVAIITRRLKEGKTYEDFRKAWYHTVGFGAPSKLYSAINGFDPREIIVMGFIDTDMEHLSSLLEIDVEQRLSNPLDEVIEPDIGRKFGIVVSEDDFSTEGVISYKPPSVRGKETDLKEISRNMAEIARMVADASNKRDRARKEKTA